MTQNRSIPQKIATPSISRASTSSTSSIPRVLTSSVSQASTQPAPRPTQPASQPPQSMSVDQAELEARIIQQVDAKQQKFTDNLLLEAYGRKRKLLKLSFWQGVFFGLGSTIGGTLVLALLIWILARVVDWFPILGDLVNKIIEHIARH